MAPNIMRYFAPHTLSLLESIDSVSIANIRMAMKATWSNQVSEATLVVPSEVFDHHPDFTR